MAFKLHPSLDAPQNKDIRKSYIDIIHKYWGDSIEQIPASVVLENLLMAHPSAYYSLFSSVSIYGSQMGAKCYSYMPLLEDTSANEHFWIIDESTIPVTELNENKI